MAADVWSRISRRWSRTIDESKVKSDDSVVQRVIGHTDVPPGLIYDEYEDCDDDDGP